MFTFTAFLKKKPKKASEGEYTLCEASAASVYLFPASLFVSVIEEGADITFTGSVLSSVELHMVVI